MRAISFILLFVISLLAIQPVVAATCMRGSAKTCCMKKEKSCCAKKGKKSCSKEKGNCCGNGICSFCSCCLTATTHERSEFTFLSIAQKNTLALTQNKNALAGYLNSPFQPPEICWPATHSVM